MARLESNIKVFDDGNVGGINDLPVWLYTVYKKYDNKEQVLKLTYSYDSRIAIMDIFDGICIWQYMLFCDDVDIQDRYNLANWRHKLLD